MTQARLYYEAHVTVEAGCPEQWDVFASMVRGQGWRASKFDEDEVDDMSGKWFTSYRETDMQRMITEVARFRDQMRRSGLLVLRWKIEDTVLDSKHGDMLEMLT